MNPARTLRTLAASTLLLAAGGAFAAEDIFLENGTSRRGEILEVLEDGIRVKGAFKGGQVEMVLKSDHLDAAWFYGLRDRAAGEDAKAHLKLAMWAIEKGLFSRAEAQVRRARELDPELLKDLAAGGRLVEIREGIAARILESARRDAKEGRLGLAGSKTELLLARMPDTPAGAEAADFLPEVEGMVEAKEAKAREEERSRLAEAERKEQEERDRLLGKVEEMLKKGRAVASEALREDNHPKAVEGLGQALQIGEQALDRLASIEKGADGDGKLLAGAADLRATITAAMLKGYVHRAEMFLWRGSTAQAKEQLEKASKLVPGDPSIDEVAERIARYEEDQNDDDRWRRGSKGDSRFGGRRGAAGGGRR